jgi:SAM-dependent methyltransferase
MKNLPEVSLSFAPLTRMLCGGIPGNLLLTAIELKVFTHLSAPRSAESLAREIGTHLGNTRAFLDALAANDLLDKSKGEYRNTPLVEMFLVEGKPTYIGEALVYDAQWTRPGLEDLAALVKDGPPAPGDPWGSVSWPRAARIQANAQRAGRAQQAAAIVGKLPEFPQMRKMLDLGGGAGLIGIAIVAAHPTMTGVIFDRPGVVDVAQRFISEYELEERVTVLAGDYSADPIGSDYDLVWTSYTLPRDNLEPIIRKIHGALNPGGVYVSLAEGLTHERTRPTFLINAMLATSLTSQEVMFEEGEIAQAMRRVGFKSVHTRVAESPQFYGPAIVDIARK